MFVGAAQKKLSSGNSSACTGIILQQNEDELQSLPKFKDFSLNQAIKIVNMIFKKFSEQAAFPETDQLLFFSGDGSSGGRTDGIKCDCRLNVNPSDTVTSNQFINQPLSLRQTEIVSPGIIIHSKGKVPEFTLLIEINKIINEFVVYFFFVTSKRFFSNECTAISYSFSDALKMLV